MWRAILLAAAVFVLGAADAAADTAYGGGYLHSAREKSGAFTVSAFHDEARSVVRVRVDANLTCKPPGFTVDFAASVPVTNGTGTASGRRTMPLLTGRARIRWALAIRLEGPRATGTLTLTGTERFRGRSYRCRPQRDRPFTLAQPGDVGGPGTALAPNAALVGLGESVYARGSLSPPVMLFANRTGRQVRGTWAVRMRCSTGVDHVTNFSPYTPVRADGSFVKRERFRVRYLNDAVSRYRATFAGRIVAGGALGTLRLSLRGTRRNGSRYRCDSGTQRWRAVAVR